MATGVQVWSTTASANSTSDTNINWPEGMAPSQVNDSARAEMASVAKWRDDNNGTIVTSGTTAAYTVTSNQVEGALTSGYTIAFQIHATNDSSATLNVDGLGGKPLQVTCGTNLQGGELLVGNIYRATYSTTGTGQWLIQGADALGSQPNIVTTTNITNAAVTYAKLQNEAATTLLGNPTNGSAAPSEISIGTGLVVSGTSLTAPAFPPTTAFKNLSIKVTGGTSATCAADFVTVATSGSSAFQTVAFPSAGINFGTNGAVNALDTGTIAGNNTWYAIYAIATAAATSVGFLASTSFSSPTMPSGYTYKARIGALVTTTSTTSINLHGVYQFGRQAQFVVGVGGTTLLPAIASGSVAVSANTSSSALNWSTKSTTNFVPTTATVVNVSLIGAYNGGAGANTATAPSTVYGGVKSANPPPIGIGNASNLSLAGRIILESSNLYYVSDASGGAVVCLGWEDNI